MVNRLNNNTELKWDANTDADIAGYEIVYRDTTAAEWTNSIPVPIEGVSNALVAAATSAGGNADMNYVVKAMSKDNYSLACVPSIRPGNGVPCRIHDPCGRVTIATCK
jgi:hypothetical protein